MLVRSCLFILAMGLCLAMPAHGQFKDDGVAKPKTRPTESPAVDPPQAPSPAQPTSAEPDSVVGAPPEGGTVRCRRGMVIRAQGGTCRSIVGTMAVPANLPGEQEVHIAAQDIPTGASVKFRTLEGGTRQMVISLPSLASGQEVQVAVAFDVVMHPWPTVPADAAQFSAPNPAKTDRKLTPYLLASPLIESNHASVARLAAEIIGDKDGAWDKVRAIHAWVYQNIAFKMPPKLGRQSVLETIEKRMGVCAEKNSLAVALLRASRIPARLVRIASTTSYEHCYYEFYLVAADGTGVWFAGDASKTPTLEQRVGSKGRIILQKGDNLVVPSPMAKGTVKQRFLETTLAGLPSSAGARLELEMIGH